MYIYAIVCIISYKIYKLYYNETPYKESKIIEHCLKI